MLTDIALRSKRAWGYDDAFMQRIMPDMLVTREALQSGYGIVAEDDGVPIGYALARMLDDGEAFLNDLFIEPERMRSGIGRALLDAVLVWACAQGAHRLTLHGDPNAMGFYEHCGFVHEGDAPSSFIPGRCLPIMGLRL